MTVTFTSLVLALLVLGASAVGCVVPAVAGPMPDRVQMVLMRRSIEETPLVRMRGSFGTQWTYYPQLDSNGVTVYQRLEGGRNAMRAAVSQIEVIAWDDIASLETDRAPSAAGTALAGGLFGLVLGAMILDSKPDHSGAAVLAYVGGGLVVGRLLGQHGKTRKIYPPRSLKEVP